MTHNNIAIVGAGLAGASLAHRLLKAGCKVTIYEKSRGTGGRLARCRIGETTANMGAPWFEPRSPAFRHWLTQQAEIQKFNLSPSDFSGQSLPQLEIFTATPTQSSLTRRLVDGATLQSSTRIARLQPGRKGVLIEDDQGQVLASHDAAIVTVPAPQAIALLSSKDGFATQAARVIPQPKWVTVVSLQQPSGATSSCFSGRHPLLSRVVKQPASTHSGGPLRETWLLEANAEWSDRHQNDASHSVTVDMLQSFTQLTDRALDITGLRSHLWLYAQHTSPLTENYLWCPEQRIGACGDWFNRPGSEGAWFSANLLADKLLDFTERQ
ncbi:NAD(P)/FAD-dependent oxidoreductase [Porticoccus sp.]